MLPWSGWNDEIICMGYTIKRTVHIHKPLLAMTVSWRIAALAAVSYLDRCLRRFLLSLLILFFFHCRETMSDSQHHTTLPC